MKVLVTGAAGFIGFHTVMRLLNRGDTVVGLDNLNDYYDVSLKEARIREIRQRDPDFEFHHADLADLSALASIFETGKFDGVINLAAQAGVRYAAEKPHTYVQSNLVGFVNLLECCRHNRIGHLVYASSSSVYGANEKQPFSVRDSVDHPVSLYAATKKSNELMAHVYSELFQVPTTGLRFFTVYGPWGRPDMSPFLFTRAILEGKAIDVFNYGKHRRDFTYVDDVVEGVLRVLDRPAQPNPDWNGASPDPATSRAPYRVYNIGNTKPVNLLDYIEMIERKLGKTVHKNLLPMQPGDVPDTWADVTELIKDTGYQPTTDLEEGIGKFVAWYKEYYQLS